MELKKESIQMLRIKNKAAAQATFDEDYNVPDVKPDIGRLVQSKADVSMEEVRLSEGRALLKGTLNADLLYVGEKEGRIYSLSAKLPLDEMINLEGIEGGDKLCLKWEIEDLSVHMIHSRKLNIKAIVTFYAVVDELAVVELPVSAEDQEVSVKTEKVRLMSLRVHKKDTLRIKDDITLASNRPNVENLLWYMAEPRNLDLRPGENKLRVKGELAVFLLYTGYEEENPPQWLEYTMPFSNEMECSGCMEDLIPHIEVSLLHQGIEVKPDPDGEERILQVDVVLELNMKMYREEEHELLLDAYSPHKECVLHRKKEMLESLLVRNFSRCRLTDRIEVKESQGKVLQLCHSSGKVKVDKTRITDKGIVAEGIVALKAGSTLTFDTYNDIFHVFSDPSNALQIGSDGLGMEGDYEFTVMEATAEKVILQGKKTGNTIIMTPLNGSWTEYLNGVIEMDQKISRIPQFTYTDGNFKASVVQSYRTWAITYQENGEPVCSS